METGLSWMEWLTVKNQTKLVYLIWSENSAANKEKNGIGESYSDNQKAWSY